MTGLRRGLFTASPLALAVTLVVALAWAALALVRITPSWILSMDERVLMVGSTDEYGLLTSRVLRLADRPRSPDEVLLLGSSMLRESVSSADDLVADLHQRLGRDVPVYNLSAGGQSPLECLAIAEHLGPMPGLVVVTPTFAYPLDEYLQRVAAPRLGFRSERMDAYLRELGGRPPAVHGIYAVDNLRFLVLRLPSILLNSLTGPPPYKVHTHLGREAFGGAPPERDVHERLSKYTDLDRRFDVNGRIYDELRARVHEAGGEVVFVHGTLNPAYAATMMTPETADYDRRLHEYVDRTGAILLDVQPHADLHPEDFNDTVHLASLPAMQRFTAALAGDLAPMLEGRR